MDASLSDCNLERTTTNGVLVSDPLQTYDKTANKRPEPIAKTPRLIFTLDIGIDPRPVLSSLVSKCPWPTWPDASVCLATTSLLALVERVE